MLKKLKEKYPDWIVIASVMEEYDKHAWEELIDRVEQTGVLIVYNYSSPGGYSCKAVHPITLAKGMNIAQMMKFEFDDMHYSLSGIGGVETGSDAAEFILLGENTVQVHWYL
ncbi:hypothetical protein IFM89_006156 [Coptis chinensis]|uniref:Uncharacterized protein n=1 Tax=Coptis chinensis TaxID=261450 RepID=A0A835LCY5_9MAGN|nr:hypothetical protein IFM89_006156 [Coptis chinensis]